MQTILCTLVYVIYRDQVLMMRRLKEPNYGLWSAPGGKLEPGEAPVECARRELKEETGISIDKLTLRAVLNDDGPEHWLLFVYVGEIDASLPRPETIECKEGELKWIDKDTILTLDIPASDKYFYPKVIEMNEPLYEAKFLYDENEVLIDQIDFSKCV